jgi:fumarate hydratase subunit alpha
MKSIHLRQDNLKTINEETLFEAAYCLIRNCCTQLPSDVMQLLKKAYSTERSKAAKSMLDTMIKNAKLAAEEDKPLCQSPGYPVVYAKIGSETKIDANIQKVFLRALIHATKEGYLRPSIVHPISRKNPGDNSGIGVPDLEIEFDPNLESMEVLASFKGCGAELVNVQKVLTPTDVGINGIGIKRLLLQSVVAAGGIPCPPVAIGVGIGGQIHYASKLSRKVVSVRKWTDRNPDAKLEVMERDFLKSVNELGIGPAGVGGDTTALAVKVALVSTHAAICPVAINFHCWVGRRGCARIHRDRSIEYPL